MAQLFQRIGLFLVLSVLASVASAQNGTVQGNEEVLSEDFILLPPELWFPSGNDESRTDVREATLPPPPSGPATLMPFCGPGDPICP